MHNSAFFVQTGLIWRKPHSMATAQTVSQALVNLDVRRGHYEGI